MIADIFDADFIVPLLVFSIPIIAIIGGIVAGVVRTIGNQRLIELAQRERIAAIERGVDLSKLPPFPGGSVGDFGGLYLSPADAARRRAAGLRTGGIIAIAVGVSVALVLRLITSDHSGASERHIWAVGIIPATVGIALLISAMFESPKNGA
jgi:energy-converting hydrogenase Eha subunit A